MPYTHTSRKAWSAEKSALVSELTLWGSDRYSLTAGTASTDGVEAVRPSTKLNQTPEEATVTLVVYWPKSKDREPLTIRYNQQARAVDNLAVIRLCVHDLRLNEARGLDALMREAYLQLPAGAPTKIKRDPYEVLGVTKETPLLVVEAAYRVLAKEAHPDSGGTTEAMAELNEAYDVVKKAARS